MPWGVPVSDHTDPALTFTICSNRPAQLCAAVARLRVLLAPGDHLLVVVDLPDDDDVHLISAIGSDLRIRVLRNGANLGLSRSRNRAMAEAASRFLVFLDDDITSTPETLDQLRSTLAAGAQIVGTRITADLQGRSRPWYLTRGQLHYLGCHDPAGPATIWGGCFAVDVDYARRLTVTFDERLGRTAGTLNSAEDTTFVRELTRLGAAQVILHGTEVTHQIPAHRLRLAYLLRRAYWQGRSETCRGTPLGGLRKEWRRNHGAGPSDGLRAVLALLYIVAVGLGIGRQLVSDRFSLWR
jgi:glycosyltransferase involved in cell wall biosynthesis